MAYSQRSSRLGIAMLKRGKKNREEGEWVGHEEPLSGGIEAV